jgi:hypothetical protein
MNTMAAGYHKQDVNCDFFCTYGNRPCVIRRAKHGSGFLALPIPVSRYHKGIFIKPCIEWLIQ